MKSQTTLLRAPFLLEDSLPASFIQWFGLKFDLALLLRNFKECVCVVCSRGYLGGGEPPIADV